MESPVRSVETGENGGGGGGGGGARGAAAAAASGASAAKDHQSGGGVAGAVAGAGGAGGGGGAATSASQQRFEAKSYLERQVEELSCADEDEAQEKVSKRLQFKQEQAQKKRCVYHTYVCV